MIEFKDLVWDILGHGYVEVTIPSVFPIELDAAIEATGPVGFDGVIFFQGVY